MPDLFDILGGFGRAVVGGLGALGRGVESVRLRERLGPDFEDILRTEAELRRRQPETIDTLNKLRRLQGELLLRRMQPDPLEELRRQRDALALASEINRLQTGAPEDLARSVKEAASLATQGVDPDTHPDFQHFPPEVQQDLRAAFEARQERERLQNERLNALLQGPPKQDPFERIRQEIFMRTLFEPPPSALEKLLMPPEEQDDRPEIEKLLDKARQRIAAARRFFGQPTEQIDRTDLANRPTKGRDFAEEAARQEALARETTDRLIGQLRENPVPGVETPPVPAESFQLIEGAILGSPEELQQLGPSVAEVPAAQMSTDQLQIALNYAALLLQTEGEAALDARPNLVAAAARARAMGLVPVPPKPAQEQ